jgi:DNA/RNA endonuclease YhcR with UshA esterase domain
MQAMLMATLATGLIVLPALAGDEKPLTPVEATKKVNEKVAVQMEVKAAKNRLEKRGEIYLDSEEDFRDEKNLGVVVTRAGAAKFKKAGIDDPAEHFMGKIIRVSGTVLIKEERPRIEIDAPDQIKAVEKK